MTRKPLDDELREWGKAHARRYVRAEPVPYTQIHALDRAREFAPGTRARAAVRLAGRDGHSRMRIMGYAAGIMSKDNRSLPVPAWACDPIPCVDTRKRTPRESVSDAAFDADAVIDVGVPDQLLWIDHEVSRLSQVTPLFALVLAVEYQEAGNQGMKARIASERYGGSLSVSQYKRALHAARVWIESKADARRPREMDTTDA